PFDRIDLFVIGPDRPGAPGGGKEMKIVRPLLQNVRVKATGNTARRETAADGREYDRRYSTLTLDLLPDEIGKVLIAQENGELKAALKRPEQDDVRYRPTRESDLWAEDGGGAGGGVVFYIGGKGGALQPETLPFAGDSVAGGAASGTGMRLPAGGEMARNALPPREARREEKTDDRGASVPAPSVAASRTTDGTNERAR
ncbi:MAG: hypothetical protein LBD06_09645, partial [Candidatus Accumulibacter sp.]|nr:hypothetical protein [Accumulibacter sp.]